MYIAIDIGGTKGRAAAYANCASTEPLGPVEQFRMTQHSRKQSGDFLRDYSNLLNACGRLRGSYWRQYGRVKGIGVALAGKLDRTRERLTMAGNIAHWVDEPVKVLLEGNSGCRVVLGNDAEAAALAEAVYGVASSEFRALISWA